MVNRIFRIMEISPPALFNALAHETRLRCLLLLLAFDELCVCELTHALGAAQPHISRHLGQLREAGLVTDRRAGIWIHYRINPALPAWVVEVLRATATGVDGRKPFAADIAAVESLSSDSASPRCG